VPDNPNSTNQFANAFSNNANLSAVVCDSVVLDRTAPGWSAVAAIATSLGGEVLTSRPPSLDMAHPAAARRLHDWLQVRTTPGDSSDALE